MSPEEVEQLVDLVVRIQPKIVPDQMTVRDVASGWFLALDVRLTLEAAIAITSTLAGSREWINPGAINEVHLSQYREAHVQGKPKPRLPLAESSSQAPRQAPLQIGAGMPVRPQDVPEYAAVRGKAWGGGEPPHIEAWSVVCPHCRARVGQPCTMQSADGRVPLKQRQAHPSREDLVKGVMSI